MRHSLIVNPFQSILLLHLILSLTIAKSVSAESATVSNDKETTVSSTSKSTTKSSTTSSTTTTTRSLTNLPTTTTTTARNNLNDNRIPTTFPSPGSTEPRIITSFVTAEKTSTSKSPNFVMPPEYDANSRIYIQLNTDIDQTRSKQNESLQVDDKGDSRFISLFSQLTALCGVSDDRIEDVFVYDRKDINNTNKIAVRFSIAPDKPPSPTSADGLGKLMDYYYNSDTVTLSLLETGTVLVIGPPINNWADTSPCPTVTCGDHARCTMDLTGKRSCICDTKYTGVQCQDEIKVQGQAQSDVNPLLALIVIPIVIILVVVIVLTVLYVRRQQKRKEKEKAMMSDPGVRNQVFHNTVGKSYSTAFNDSAFNTAQESEFNDFVEPPTKKSFIEEDD